MMNIQKLAVIFIAFSDQEPFLGPITDGQDGGFLDLLKRLTI